MNISRQPWDEAAPAGQQALVPPRVLVLGPCFMCDGDGAVPIEPIHDDGAIWTIMPCDLCVGTGVLHCEAVQ